MASRTEIMTEIEGLETHCRAPLMSTDARSRWLLDWCSDLAQFDVEHIRAAVRDWRTGGNTKFPTPGLLLPLIRAKVPNRDGAVEQPRAWEPVGDGEYQAMSLSEKIRHQRILAAEARRKAGPMFRNTSNAGIMYRASGEHLAAEQMPEVWRRWSSIAADHEAEAARLTGYLRKSERAA